MPERNGGLTPVACLGMREGLCVKRPTKREQNPPFAQNGEGWGTRKSELQIPRSPARGGLPRDDKRKIT